MYTVKFKREGLNRRIVNCDPRRVAGGANLTDQRL